ncbi:MAG: alpha/beta hydrolase [Clostridia bacterium]|nr:alpha/beta hydrolase [Clostridia bacterium]
MKLLWIAAAVLAVVLVAIFLFLFYMAKKVFGRGGAPYVIDDTLKGQDLLLARLNRGRAALASLTPERVETVSEDGLRLVGDLYYAPEPSDHYLICMHGFHSTQKDFVCAVDFFLSLGYHVLLACQRTHGDSEGKWITFGVKERYDCRCWCQYLVDRFGDNIGIVLDGISMGAATVLMATELDLPKNVKAVMADCGYTSPWEIVCDVAKRSMHIPKYPFMPLFRLAVKLTAGFDLKEVSATAAMEKNEKYPVLFTHGQADDFVPHSMSVKNYEACRAPKRLVSIPEAGHGLSYLIDEEPGREACSTFLLAAKSL